MLVEALAALATAGGSAVVQAAGTDAWAGFRQAVARWFGRGDAEQERAELERLDRTVTALRTADPAQAERARISQEAYWQARMEAVLENLDEGERGGAADQLRALLAQHVPEVRVTAGPGGVATGGGMDIRAEEGSIAAGVIHGGASIGPPPTADPPEGQADRQAPARSPARHMAPCVDREVFPPAITVSRSAGPAGSSFTPRHVLR
ncbi:hypothetical protein OG592_39355 [Streptomyces avidinii]|uniref:hypothetical protein n=1 Tax=Streptomyces avidinii TaxID=1895 RepID=UPI0038688737|nr:hypothetical protein OG592_39355 [Streptomyces avidinii]